MSAQVLLVDNDVELIELLRNDLEQVSWWNTMVRQVL